MKIMLVNALLCQCYLDKLQDSSNGTNYSTECLSTSCQKFIFSWQMPLVISDPDGGTKMKRFLRMNSFLTHLPLGEKGTLPEGPPPKKNGALMGLIVARIEEFRLDCWRNSPWRKNFAQIRSFLLPINRNPIHILLYEILVIVPCKH